MGIKNKNHTIVTAAEPVFTFARRISKKLIPQQPTFSDNQLESLSQTYFMLSVFAQKICLEPVLKDFNLLFWFRK